MTLSILDNTNSPKQIIFKKNEDWLRVIDQMPAPDLNALVENKNKDVVLIGVVGHIWHTSAKILETLNTHPDFQWKTVILSETDNMPSQIDLSMAWFTQQINQNLILEVLIREDIQNVVLEKQNKPHHNKHTKNFHQQPNPKFKNKNFKTPIRKTQRKK